MNEVEKMYSNAGIEPALFYDCESYNQKVEKGYLFTAEKQIKIMELLGEVHAFFDADKTNFACITNYRIEKGIIKGYEGKGESVSEALASLVNNLWQDLTDAEKQQVKGILE